MIMRKMRWAAVLLGLAVLPAAAREMTSTITEPASIPRVRPHYPVPAEPGQVFYVERSSNSNTVVYCAHLDRNGRLDESEPIVGYWRWYNVDGHVKPLNFAERMLAYGIKSVRHDGPGGAYSFHIAAMPERTLYIGLNAQGKPEVFGRIGNRWVTLVYIFLEVDDSGLMPDVPALDIFGIDRATGRPMHEHINRR